LISNKSYKSSIDEIYTGLRKNISETELSAFSNGYGNLKQSSLIKI